ncbi:MAG: type I secretion system permease/ATPase [Desulfovibrio sp.]|uniref:type I secretion system permease/ATPase n=1 Tax=Desulfovibrio sp. TaxID=885 RepID=UPI0025C70296|nr:type I secretion system permease/ATPase [Desulfovibrio sp.]MBS6830955.1 type I secretion system permease/ATPase [Desulfovibrio sp.]
MNEFIALCKKYFGYAMLFSMFINILQLTFSIYMLQVYDRVLTSYNISTLVVITVAAVIALVTLAFLEWIRSRLLIKIGVEFDKKLSFPVLDLELRTASALQKLPDRGEIRDVQTLRGFLGSNAVFAFFDMPWMPLFFVLIFVLHPAMGVVAVIGGLLVLIFGILTQKIADPKLKEANELNKRATMLLGSATRNAPAIKAMGMIGSIGSRWHELNARVIHLQTKASRRVGLLHSISKSLRIGLQVVIYAVGAYLAITHVATAGIMIASSIVMGRALAPLDQAMATYKQSLEAKAAYSRIKATLSGPAAQEKMALPSPRGEVAVEGVSFALQDNVVLRDISFHLKPGTLLAVIGPSASGKSTLCRLLLGIWPPTAGKIRLDGADIASWESETLGAYMGYLPQDVDLFSGTVSENIARMGKVDPERVVRAAQLAGVHELILRLPGGYDTPIGDFGQGLSGGQRQRIGLARAVYGEPRVVVLDEPNSNLDEEGDMRLMQSLARLKQLGITVVLVAHKPQILAAVDEIMVLREGGILLYGPRATVMREMAEMQRRQRQTAFQMQEGKRPVVVQKVLNRSGGNERSVG